MTEQYTPGGDLSPLVDKAIPALGPIALPIQLLQALLGTVQQQERYAAKILDELEKLANYKPPAVGFATHRLAYAPGDGVKVLDLSQQNRIPVQAFSLITVKTGNEGAQPYSGSIYGGFGRSLIKGNEFAPRNHEFIIPGGGKINKYNVRQGLEAISVWSDTSFDMIMYTTAGAATELPEL